MFDPDGHNVEAVCQLVSAPRLKPVVPNVFVDDFTAALAFYTGPLGFRALFTYGKPSAYAHVVRDAAVLALRHLDCMPLGHAAAEDVSSAFIELTGVDALFQSMQSAGVPTHQTPRDEPWGMRSFIVRDPDGNLVCFAGR